MFTKCGDSLENGRRLENISWRLWHRSTFTLDDPPKLRHRDLRGSLDFSSSVPSNDGQRAMPELSHSVDSVESATHAGPLQQGTIAEEATLVSSVPSSTSASTSPAKSTQASTELQVPPCEEQQKKRRLSGKPISADTFRALVNNLVPPGADAELWRAQHKARAKVAAGASSSLPNNKSAVATKEHSGASSPSSELLLPPPAVDNHNSLPTPSSLSMTPSINNDDLYTALRPVTRRESSTKSVVRGFTPDSVSISHRRSPPLNNGGTFTLPSFSPIEDINVQSVGERPVFRPRTPSPPVEHRKTFFIQESDSSSDSGSYMTTQSATVAAKRARFNLSSRSDARNSSSAVVTDDEDDAWESDGEGGTESAGTTSPSLFHKVEDSNRTLTSRPSLLSTLLKTKSEANLVGAATATTTANPTTTSSSSTTSNTRMARTRSNPTRGQGFALTQLTDSKHLLDSGPISRSPATPMPIISPHAAPILKSPSSSTSSSGGGSPRTTRRNMLASELSESLRRNLLWERQQKNLTRNAILKRRHTSHDLVQLQQQRETQPPLSSSNSRFPQHRGKPEFDTHDAVW